MTCTGVDKIPHLYNSFMHGLKYKVAYDYFIALVTAHPPKGK
jgi:hypothetical protein